MKSEECRTKSLFTLDSSLFAFKLLTLPAFAKINWSLRVLGRRADGFHEICTTFQTVSLHDNLSFELSDDLSLSSNDSRIPEDERNIVVRAAQQLREQFAIRAGAKIYLEKRIPSPGGLGGGSADAAVALLALTALWKVETKIGELVKIGKTLGADVPFFLFGGTAYATGLGTEIEELPDLPRQLLLIVTPPENVPTAAAYQSLGAPALTEADSLAILTICHSARIGSIDRQTQLVNDFENVIFGLKPEIKRAKLKLLETGAQQALLSGSGASVFGVFDNESARETAFNYLAETEKEWRLFACETVSRAEYKRALSPCWSLLRDSL